MSESFDYKALVRGAGSGGKDVSVLAGFIYMVLYGILLTCQGRLHLRLTKSRYFQWTFLMILYLEGLLGVFARYY